MFRFEIVDTISVIDYKLVRKTEPTGSNCRACAERIAKFFGQFWTRTEDREHELANAARLLSGRKPTRATQHYRVICERSNEGRYLYCTLVSPEKASMDLPKLLPSGSESNGLLSPTFLRPATESSTGAESPSGKIKHPAKNSQNGRYSCSVRNCI